MLECTVSGIVLAVIGTLLNWSNRCADDARSSTAVYKTVKGAGVMNSDVDRTQPVARNKRSRALIAPRPPRFAAVRDDSGDEDEPRNPSSVELFVERGAPS